MNSLHVLNMNGLPVLNMNGLPVLNMNGLPILNMNGLPVLNMNGLPVLNVNACEQVVLNMNDVFYLKYECHPCEIHMNRSPINKKKNGNLCTHNIQYAAVDHM